VADNKLRQVRLSNGGFIEGVPDALSDADAIALLTDKERAQIIPGLVRSPEERRAAGVSNLVPGQSAGAAAGRRLRIGQAVGVDVRPGEVEDFGARFAAGGIAVNTMFEKGEVVRKALALTDDDIIFFENAADPSDSTILVNVSGESW